jgi:hypothetical protein
MHVCGTVGTVTIWQYGHLLYSAHLLGMCVFVTKEILQIILVHVYDLYTCIRPCWWVCVL